MLDKFCLSHTAWRCQSTFCGAATEQDSDAAYQYIIDQNILQQYARQEDNAYDERGDVADEEIYRLEAPHIETQRASVGKLVIHIGLLHFPADKQREKQGAEGHQKIGRNPVAEAEQILPEYLEPAHRTERQGAQAAENPGSDEYRQCGNSPAHLLLLHQIGHTDLHKGHAARKGGHQDCHEEEDGDDSADYRG